jgi:uncharacterized protein (TIGR00299 family) protein
MKTLYLDIFSGISGDMFVGALIDLGIDAGKLERELTKLKLGGYHLHVSRRQKSGIEGVEFEVHFDEGRREKEEGRGHHHEHARNHRHHGHGRAHDDSRNFSEIKKLITTSKLSAWVKQKSVAVFERIAVAEGKIHGLPPDQVHFHEVGAVDSIVDIVGACIALEWLGKPRVLSAPVVEGVGWVDCAHGHFPVPAPATLAILGARGVGVTQCDEPHELVTPTGAALLAQFAERFGPMHGLVAQRIGFGVGTREHQTRPNVLRAVLGRVSGVECRVSGGPDWETDTVAVLETNLDDVTAEILGYFVERAFAAGALDVFHTPIQMKKNRPGVLLTVLCPEAEADKFTELLLRETSAFGVRRHTAERRKLRREFRTVRTPFGEVTIKIGKLDGKIVQAAPEFESCRKVAERAKVQLKEVYAAAVRCAESSKKR